MKLYTAEQIRKRLNSPMDDEVTIDEFIESLTPIELPSDEEIEQEASDFGKKYRATTYEVSSYVIGAKWMKDKIQGGNK